MPKVLLTALFTVAVFISPVFSEVKAVKENYKKTIHVNPSRADAGDVNPGTEIKPLKTIKGAKLSKKSSAPRSATRGS